MLLGLSLGFNFFLISLALWLFMNWSNSKDNANNAEAEIVRLKIDNKFLNEVQTMKNIVEKSRAVRKKDDDGLIFYEEIDDLK